jgi:DNA-binding FadR family transcriptional regulator
MEHPERMNLVTRLEEELERMISQGTLPEDGSFPSERKLARHYGVARGTIREAMLRLAERGLVARRQGRQARVVPVERAVTLESLGVVLRGLARPGRRRLLEGYLELKRDTTVEVLARGCEHASEQELELLADACFVLREGARWDDGSRRWVEREFELLRTAAVAAERPGHFLLVQSLERAFWGMAELVRPHLQADAVRHWAENTLGWLHMRDVEALKRELRPLLLACDEQVLRGLGAAPGRDELW